MRFIVTHIVFFLSLLSWGQATINVAVDKVVLQEGENMTYEITTNRNCSVVPPSFAGFEIIGGPFTGTSSSYSNYNGSSSQSTTYSFTYALRAKSKGTYTIEAPILQCGKEEVVGQEVKIEIIENGQAANIDEGIIDNYIELKSNKKEVFVGEPFILSTTFYSTEQPSSIQNIMQGTAPELWRAEIKINRVVSAGQTYYKVDLSKEVCIANNPGEITIEPYRAVLEKEIDFFNIKKLEGISNKLTIKVKPLPTERPDNFNKLVGDFELIYAISKTSVKVGEAIDLDITIKGTGNFEALQDPKLNLPESFYVYDPEIKQQTKVTPDGIVGEVKYKFVIVPSEEGEFEVLPFSFSYFDFQSKKFKGATTEILTFSIKEGDDNYGRVLNTASAEMNPKETKIEGIQKSSDKLIHKGDEFFGSIGHILGVSFPLILTLGFVFYKKRNERIAPHQKLQKTKKNIVKSSLIELENISNGQEITTIRKVIENFMFVKFDLSRSEISKLNIEKRLIDKGADQSMIDEIKFVLTNLDQASYAPISSSSITDTVQKAKSFITNAGRL